MQRFNRKLVLMEKASHCSDSHDQFAVAVAGLSAWFLRPQVVAEEMKDVVSTVVVWQRELPIAGLRRVLRLCRGTCCQWDVVCSGGYGTRCSHEGGGGGFTFRAGRPQPVCQRQREGPKCGLLMLLIVFDLVIV